MLGGHRASARSTSAFRSGSRHSSLFRAHEFFVDSIDDFVIAAWLSGGASSETVAIRIYSDARGSVTPALNALGSMMLLTTRMFLVIGGLIYRRLASRTKVGEAESLTDFVASQA
jgi:ABC-type Fe3+ transport system permease subunit